MVKKALWVLAFYYPWYGSPQGPSQRWVHWNPSQPRFLAADTPELGRYDSMDEQTLAQHVQWAKEAGITGFIASWWGQGSFEDKAFAKLLDVARRKDFAVTVLYDKDCGSPGELRADLDYLLKRYSTSPAWLRYQGKPVFFIYGKTAGKFRPGSVRRALRGLDAVLLADAMDERQTAPYQGVFFYDPIGDLAGYKRASPGFRRTYQSMGKLFCASVIPGYDDRFVRRPSKRINRSGGAIYEELWAEAAGADCVTITSWNEWHEGSEIEPSKEYGRAYLDLTRELSGRWRGSSR